MAARASRTRFFRSVCPWERWMASPKQPQSISGFAIQRIRVMMVKKTTRREVMNAVVLRKTPLISAAPVAASTRERAMPRAFAVPCRNPRWKNLKYSLTMRPVPTGSSSFSRPEARNTRPIRMAQKRRIL